MKFTMKKKVLLKIVQSLGFAEFVKFVCYDDRRLVLQAYQNFKTEHVLADVVLTPRGELNHFSVSDDELIFRYCRIKELLVELENANHDMLDDAPLITMEVKNCFLVAIFSVHSPEGDAKYKFCMSLLYMCYDRHFLYPYVDKAFCYLAATSLMSASEFSKYCTEYLKKGADSVYLAIPDPQSFEFYTLSDDGKKLDLVEMKVTTPRFNEAVFHSIKLKYLEYFIKVETVTSKAAKVETVTSEVSKVETVGSEVGISLGTNTSVVRVEYDLAVKDYIRFYLGPTPCKSSNIDSRVEELNLEDCTDLPDYPFQDTALEDGVVIPDYPSQDTSSKVEA